MSDNSLTLTVDGFASFFFPRICCLPGASQASPTATVTLRMHDMHVGARVELSRDAIGGVWGGGGLNWTGCLEKLITRRVEAQFRQSSVEMYVQL
jgi:hypothetical protein